MNGYAALQRSCLTHAAMITSGIHQLGSPFSCIRDLQSSAPKIFMIRAFVYIRNNKQMVERLKNTALAGTMPAEM